MSARRGAAALLVATGLIALAGIYCPVAASTLCVDPKISGCYPTINKAVNAANARDTITVAPGTYIEGDINISKSLSLIGANSANTIINAVAKKNGVYIDGLDNPGLNEVVVRGF